MRDQGWSHPCIGGGSTACLAAFIINYTERVRIPHPPYVTLKLQLVVLPQKPIPGLPGCAGNSPPPSTLCHPQAAACRASAKAHPGPPWSRREFPPHTHTTTAGPVPIMTRGPAQAPQLPPSLTETFTASPLGGT
ncbi:hypothetical protein C8Q76DRAFT_317861 [Earliella scabrosa]|nr:hypothetical protein C8Q76DRAFT_317861 [Earliella scabrosa]